MGSKPERKSTQARLEIGSHGKENVAGNRVGSTRFLEASQQRILVADTEVVALEDQEQAQAPLRTLIIEDSEDDAGLLVRALRRGGYQPIVERVDTAERMIAALDRQGWDIIIADYALPRFSGMAALRLWRERGLDLPFILVSGTIGEETAVEAMKAGAHDYVMKDNLSRLVPAIKREIRDAAVRRERRQAEEALRESEARFRRLAENAQDLIFRYELSPRSGFSYVSPASTRITGYTPHEHYADPDLPRKIVHPEDRQLIEGMFGDGSVPPSLTVRWQHKQGHTTFSELRTVPIYDGRGTLVAIEGIARDITENKRMEEQLLRAERLEMAGRIASQVAHDFANLLSPLVGYPQLIKKQLPEGHASLRHLDALLKAARQMAAINEDLLTLGRRGHFNREPTDLNELVQQAVAQMPERPATLAIHLELDSNLLPVNGAGAQLLRVISNLLSNAREAMGDVGRLSIKSENVYVDTPVGHYNLVEVGEYVCLEVRDSGCGIAPEIMDKIFDPFFTTKCADNHRGSGLGLSIVQTIVGDHRGFLDVQSRPGNGTTFTIYLPTCRARLETSPDEALKGGNETVLVVDDDQTQRELAKDLLQTLGYRVDVAASGEEAVAHLERHQVDLLMLDMVMPSGIDGTETYRRALEVRPGQRAIIVSGFAEANRVREAQELGAGPYLRKPVTLEKLAATVREELSRSNHCESRA